MTIRQLEIFLAVIQTASVTRAAERIHLSPGAVSLQLHHLAGELHTDLFVRSGNRFVPTPDALRLAERAGEVLRQLRQIQHEYQSDFATDLRPFHFATGTTTLIYRLGRPLRLLRTQYPRIEIRVSVLATEEIVAGLLDRRFDLGLVSLPVRERELKIMPLYEEELLLLRPSRVRVRGGQVGSIRSGELANVPFLLYPKQSNMRSVIDRFFREIGLTPRVVMEAADTEAIKRLVESGFGCSILPEYALRGQSSFFRTLRIAGHRLIRRQALAMVRTAHPRKLTESIAEFLQSTLAPR
jgi:DNA-binding transcriptional LysR family regulator